MVLNWLRRFALAMLASAPVSSLAMAQVDEPSLPPPADRLVRFETDIRPMFEAHCISCHGPDQRKGGLRLDNRSDGLAGGDSGPMIEPGDSALSYLIEKVAGLDPLSTMPPSDDPLTPEQIGILRAWIDQGPDWPDSDAPTRGPSSDHWAFQAPELPELPTVSDPSWPRNPIDHFILARLDAEGLAPAPEADRTTLIRRLSLDLIGLPPTPEEVDAFVNDPRADAYEHLVDRLLASPHYGERWGRRWLDLARYADSNGYEKDRQRSIWPFRDWVIRALNNDLPFDQFTIEQVAGDLLPDPSVDQRVATGFHRNTMINEEGGIDVEEFRYAAVVDRVATTGSTWLGLTVACAQCHTHKYDPITQREYYQLFAFLNNADEPELPLPDPETLRRRAELQDEIDAVVASLPSLFPVPDNATGDESLTEDERRRQHLTASMARWEEDLTTFGWTPIAPSSLASKNGATMEVLEDRSVLVSGDKPNQDVYTVELETDLEGITALRLEVLPHESLPNGGPGRAPLFSVGDFLLTEFTVEAGSKGADLERITIAQASEDYAEKGHPASMAIDGVYDTGWNVKGAIGQPHAAVFAFAEPVGKEGNTTRFVLTLRQEYIHQMTIGRFRLSATTDAGPVRASGLPSEIEAIAQIPPDERTAEQHDRITAYYLSVAPELGEHHERIVELRKAMPSLPTTMVMQERRPEHTRTTQIHQRGEFLQPTGNPVDPGVPSVLHPLPEDQPLNRLTLARWLVSENNPLVARVTVNRLWAGHFGRGLVPTLDDFGTRGEPPSHPDLLDWLAVTFVDEGWSQKAIHRWIVTSATYRQSSNVEPSLLDRDLENVLLARGPRFRLEAELVRDLALSASGLLTPTVGGPSVYPPQPDGVTALAYGGPGWPTSTGPDRYRRGLYTFIKRTAPYAAFTTFDAPTSEVTCTRRERSNTPLQALTLLNDPVFIEAAQALAQRIVSELPEGDAEARAARAFRLCLSREPDASELAAILDFYQAQRDRIASGELDAETLAGTADSDHAVELAAWTTVSRALLNLDETITVE
ncbi:PSD1 and planctomycete cytochrome C domain-containing protein [Tautonia rosea]|uniref:PSD1 and planctomycete cytochrome C domain-containing protein n=1 Tax=Tautonia rosea TaxID=2728037 RepID=UPI00147429FB|nr:PSD1 and planctomycete cytochrome C domain-containing protein [Tautonia rosea]